MLYLVLNLMYLYTFLYFFIFLFIVIYFNFNILEPTSCNLVCINPKLQRTNQLVLQSDLEKYVKCQPELVKSDKYNRTSPIHNVELYPKP